MPKKTIINPAANAPVVTPAAARSTVTPSRKTVIPKSAPAAAPAPVATPSLSPKKAPKPITYEMISERAYFIAMSGTGGTPDENWYRAERELQKESML